MTEKYCGADAAFAQRSDRVELIMPAQESMLTLTRLTVAGLMANKSRDFDTLEDVKSAAAEACYCLLQQPCGYIRLSLCFVFDENELKFCVSGLEPSMQAQRLESMKKCEDVAICILESMVDHVDISTHDGVIEAFTLTKHIV